MWPIFLKIIWVDKIKKTVNIRTESLIFTNFSVQSYGFFIFYMTDTNRSYVRRKKVNIKVPPVAKQPLRNNIASFFLT